MRSRTIALAAVFPALLAGLAAALILAGCGGGGSDQATAQPRPKSVPPFFHQAHYDVRIYTGWPQDESDKKVGSYLESAWHDPAGSIADILIDSRESADTGSPIANAELARVQAEQLPGYREHDFKKVMLGAQPAVRWAYDLSGKERLDYFFERCGTSFIVRGSFPPTSLAIYPPSIQTMASAIKVVCDT